MMRQSKRRKAAPTPQTADLMVAIPGASYLMPLALCRLIMNDKWEQHGYRDYQDFVARTGVSESLAIRGMSMALQQMLFNNAARERYGREKINQLDQVLSYDLEGLTLSQLMIRIADIFGGEEQEPACVPVSASCG